MGYRRKILKELRNIRIEKGWTQKDLASRLKCDRSFISLLERDKRELSLKVLERICRLYEITLVELVVRTVDKTDEYLMYILKKTLEE